MSRKLLITEPFCKEHMELIAASVSKDFSIVQLPSGYSEEDLKRELSDAEIVIGEPDPELISNPEKNCPKLKLIQMLWAGTDIYTRGPFTFPKEAVKLCNASGAYGMIISQFVIAQILTVMLNFKTYHNQQNEKIWQRQGPIKSLEGAKVLIFGAGDIGTCTAKRLTGFDAYTIGVCKNTSKKREYFNELCTLEEAEKFIPEADVIIGCIPNLEETTGFMDRRRLSLMKKDSIIVNVGRGNFIDNMALNDLINEGKIWGAALDVTNPEPLPKDHPLWSNPRVMITPHASGVAFSHMRETENLLCKIACENLARYSNNHPLINSIY